MASENYFSLHKSLDLEVAATASQARARTVPWGGLREGPGHFFTITSFLPELKVTWPSCRSQDKSRGWKWWLRLRRSRGPWGLP